MKYYGNKSKHYFAKKLSTHKAYVSSISVNLYTKPRLLALALAALLLFCVATQLHAQTAGLVLWNKLGSQQEVENSEIGPPGTLTGGGFTSGFFGGAYVAGPTEDFLLTFPADIAPTARGAVEFWSKLTNPPVSLFIQVLVGLVSPTVVPPGFVGHALNVALNRNDGCGGGGLTGIVNAATDNVCSGLVRTSTGDFGSWTYETVLGASSVEDWHHYAMAWDEDGVPGVRTEETGVVSGRQSGVRRRSRQSSALVRTHLTRQPSRFGLQL